MDFIQPSEVSRLNTGLTELGVFPVGPVRVNKRNMSQYDIRKSREVNKVHVQKIPSACGLPPSTLEQDIAPSCSKCKEMDLLIDYLKETGQDQE